MGNFVLLKDKIVTQIDNYSGKMVARTFVESGTYKIVRKFDADRVMVETSKSPRQVTLLRTDKGLVYGGSDEI